MDIKEFINGKVTYGKDSQFFWVNTPTGGLQMLLQMRGWGHIQNMFTNNDGSIDIESATQYQDELGNWIAEAINEKIQRDFH